MQRMETEVDPANLIVADHDDDDDDEIEHLASVLSALIISIN
jgi:hypothetical protein